MNRQLAQCPFCRGCDIALDDRPQLVFNPGTDRAAPCAHLLRVEARYAEFDRTQQGVARVLGSTDCRWDHPGLGPVDEDSHLLHYLRELVNNGAAWEFAPKTPCEIVKFSTDEKRRDPKGHEYPLWELDGEALFTRDAGAFLAELLACRERHLAALRVEPEDEQA